MHVEKSDDDLSRLLIFFFTKLPGQVGRSLGPLIFCTLYWWAGRETAYIAGGLGMIGVGGLVFAGLKMGPLIVTEDGKAKKEARTAIKDDETNKERKKKSKGKVDDVTGMTDMKKVNGKVNGNGNGNGNGIAKKPDLRRRKV